MREGYIEAGQGVVLRFQYLELDLADVIVEEHWVVQSLQSLHVPDVRSYYDQLLHSLIVVDFPVECDNLLLVILALIEPLLMSGTLGDFEKDMFKGLDPRVLFFLRDPSLL